MDIGIPFTVPINAVASPAAAFDAFELIAASGKPFILERVVLGQSSDYGDAAAEGLSVAVKRATGSYTSGSGGSSTTPQKHFTNSPAAGSSAETMNTTQAAAGSGALNVLHVEPMNIQAGLDYFPPPAARHVFLGGEACVVSVSAPADAVTVSGYAIIREI